QLLARPRIVAPAILPSVVRRVKLARVVEVYAGDVLDRIRRHVHRRVRRLSHHAVCHCPRIIPLLMRAAITFAAVAPAPTAPAMVGASGLATSPMAKTPVTLVSCAFVTTA